MAAVKEPKRYNEIKEYMNDFIVIEKGDPKLTNPLAFVLIRDSLVGETYKMFYNNKDADLTKRLYMHEAGHIIYDHIENLEMKSASVSSRIRAKYEKCKDRFTSPEKFFEYFKREIFNQVMDFEVNSKLFSWKEFLQTEKMTSKLLGTKVMLCHPSRYGYPVGKTWKEYLTYVLNDLDRFIDNKLEEMNQMKQENKDDDNNNDNNNNGNAENDDLNKKPGENGDDTQSQKDSSSKGSKKEENKENSSSNSSSVDDNSDEDSSDEAMSPETDQELRHHSANSEIRNGERPKFTSEQEAEIAKGVKDGLNKNLEDAANKIEGNDGKCSETIGSFGHSEKFETTESTFDEIKKELLDKVFSRKLVQTRRDMMYNVNRKKLSSNVIVPRDTQRVEFRADDFIVILDVSGSVSQKLLNKTLNVFKELSNKFGRKSRIIFWDTELQEDSLIKDVDHGYSGGGTDIAAGIKYVNEKNYIKNGTKLFIISDFCDYLNEWEKELRKLKSREVYGICWEKDADLSRVKKSFKNIYFLKSSEL